MRVGRVDDLRSRQQRARLGGIESHPGRGATVDWVNAREEIEELLKVATSIRHEQGCQIDLLFLSAEGPYSGSPYQRGPAPRCCRSPRFST